MSCAHHHLSPTSQRCVDCGTARLALVIGVVDTDRHGDAEIACFHDRYARFARRVAGQRRARARSLGQRTPRRRHGRPRGR